MRLKDEISELIVIFNGEELTANQDGRFAHYPEGFIDHTEKVLAQLLQLRVEKA